MMKVRTQMPITPAKTIEVKLTALFALVEPKFREATINRYLLTARSQFAGYKELLAGEEPPRDRWYHDVVSTPQYVSWTGGMSTTWEARVKAMADGVFFCNEKKATEDAIASVRYAREHFISKQTKKLTNATQLRTDRPTIEGTLKYNVLIEGSMSFKYKNGDSFALTMSMIVNHRFERGYTSFYQFPARFGNVYIGGKRAEGRISEKWMSENFK
jgi:hypothetical protein